MESKTKIRERNFAMIRRWQSSGKSQVKFCEVEGVTFHQFYYWYKKFRDQPRAVPAGFVQLKTEGDKERLRTEVCFANGNRIVFQGSIDMARLRELAS